MNLGNKKNFSPIIPFIIILAIIISLSPTAISAQENATNSEIQNAEAIENAVGQAIQVAQSGITEAIAEHIDKMQLPTV